MPPGGVGGVKKAAVGGAVILCDDAFDAGAALGRSVCRMISCAGWLRRNVGRLWRGVGLKEAIVIARAAGRDDGLV